MDNEGRCNTVAHKQRVDEKMSLRDVEGRCNTVAHGQRVEETVRLDEPHGFISETTVVSTSLVNDVDSRQHLVSP